MSRDADSIRVRNYVWGFVLSLILSLVAYFAVVDKWLTGWSVVGLIACLAIAQAMVQLRMFLHVGEEAAPRWKFVVFWFTVLVVGILVGGSLWIMYNLESRMMMPMARP
jgi:cytochrome o ubiquinol oxidase operon protein cyoD